MLLSPLRCRHPPPTRYHALFRSYASSPPSKPPTTPSTWIFIDGTRAARRQSIALAEALKLPYELKPVYPSKAINWLPVLIQKYIVDFAYVTKRPATRLPWYLSSPSAKGVDPLAGPYPEFVIASGDTAIAPCLEVGKRSGGQSFTVYLRFPDLSFVHFDQVVLAKIDSAKKLARTGPWATDQNNYISTLMPLTPTTPARLASIDTSMLPEPFASADPSLDQIVTVLVGRSTKQCRWYSEDAKRVVDQCKRMIETHNARVLLLCSAQLPDHIRKVLTDRVASVIPDSRRGDIHLHDAQVDVDDRVYEAALAVASRIVVTADQEVGTTEAVATGKPTYTLFTSRCKGTLSHFHRWLRDRGLTRHLRFSTSRPRAAVVTSDGRETDPFSDIGDHPPWGDRVELMTSGDLEEVARVVTKARNIKVQGKRVVGVEVGER